MKNRLFAPSDLKINLLSAPLGVDKNDLRFFWHVNGAGNNIKMSAYRIVISEREKDMSAGVFVFDSGWVESDCNTSVRFDDLSGILRDNSAYLWVVSIKDTDGNISDFSEPQRFTTAVCDEWKTRLGLWTESRDDHIFARCEFTLTQKEKSLLECAVISVTARSPEPTRQFVYNLYVNGCEIGVGPARIGSDADRNKLLFYNTYDLTDKLNAGKNCVSAFCYTVADKRFLCQLVCYFSDGSTKIIMNSGEKYPEWRVFGGDSALGKDNSIGTGYYVAYANNINTSLYPFGFKDVGFDDTNWTAPVYSDICADGLILTPSQEDNVKRYKSPKDKMQIKKVCDGYIIDLGREIIGGFGMDITTDVPCELTLTYGEQLENQRVKYAMNTGNKYIEKWKIDAGSYSLATQNMMAFRYVGISGCPVEITRDMVCGYEIRTGFEPEKSHFSSDNKLLCDIYDLMKHTAKVTTQDLFVDSQSRERGAYEGDLLVNLYGVYPFSDNYSIARFTSDYLYMHRTWPAEYILYVIFAARIDYTVTGDISSLEKFYKILKKNTFDQFRDPETGLLQSGNDGENSMNAILTDWPPSERDGYDRGRDFSTVFNAAAVRGYYDLAFIARELGYDIDADKFKRFGDQLKSNMITRLFNEEVGAFADGCDRGGNVSGHFSQHASVYALACGVSDTPEMNRKLAGFIDRQGKIRMSVFGAFFIFDGLYRTGYGNIANKLLLDVSDSEGERTWAYMLRGLGATVTSEAWNVNNKPNMTLSHPWGAAPSYAIVNGIFGIQPIRPGYAEIEIKPQTDGIDSASITIPIIRGNMGVSFENNAFKLTLPANTVTRFYPPTDSETVRVNGEGKRLSESIEGKYLALGSGEWEIII